MTSRNSFWDRSRENHKRRIWVWIVSVFVQLVVYIGFVTIYLTRIRRWNTEGAYRTTEAFKRAMCEATQDALGFSNYEGGIVIALAVIIGMQGFAYLYDRRKVDMYGFQKKTVCGHLCKWDYYLSDSNVGQPFYQCSAGSRTGSRKWSRPGNGWAGFCVESVIFPGYVSYHDSGSDDNRKPDDYHWCVRGIDSL